MVEQIIGITPLIEKICIKKAGRELNPANTETSKLAEYNGTSPKCQQKCYNIFLILTNALSGLDFFVTINDNM
ncbi:hypothetical protein D1BOALGB6SA_8116 [Olavius sp. associated proteobacterium Delta 1]|nr:hypothetical protein D1BOALGB6SA_8116 [Olavius sp. associated proteobacterium Delta 1]